MRTLTGIVAVLLIQLLAACDRALPVAPSPPPPSLPAPTSPPPPSPPAPTGPSPVNGDKWDLTTTLTSIAGPRECVPVGSPPPGSGPGDYEQWLMTIERSGDSMHLITSSPRVPADTYEYIVTVAGADFSGSGTNTPSGYFACGPSGRDYVDSGDDRLAGRLSADGKTLTADEELVFRLTSGNVITYHFAWTATKQ